MVPKIGDIYMVRFVGRNSEQTGWRPGLVFQNDIGNRYSPNVIVLPLTSSLKKLDQPTHVLVKASDTGLIRDSMVLCENPTCISKSSLGKFITHLPAKYMKQVAAASLIATSAIVYLDPDSLGKIWDRANDIQRSVAL